MSEAARRPRALIAPALLCSSMPRPAWRCRTVSRSSTGWDRRSRVMSSSLVTSSSSIGFATAGSTSATRGSSTPRSPATSSWSRASTRSGSGAAGSARADCFRSLGSRFRTASFESQVLVRGRPRIVGDEPEPRLGDARTVPLQESELPDRQVHGLLVDQLLDAMQDRLALLAVELDRLLSEEAVDVPIAYVGVDAARDRERLEPGGRVPEDTAQAVDDVLQLLLLIRLEEPGPLERAQPRPDPHGLQVIEHRLAVPGGPGIAPEVPRLEALRVPGFREEVLRPGRIVGI